MRRRRARVADPLAAMPAELDEFDPREWAAPGEDPSEAEWLRGAGRDQRRSDDYRRCYERHSTALHAWFGEHPGASFLDWIRGKRARRRPTGG